MARKRSIDSTPFLFGFDFTPASTVAESIEELDKPIFGKEPELLKESPNEAIALGKISIIDNDSRYDILLSPATSVADVPIKAAEPEAIGQTSPRPNDAEGSAAAFTPPVESPSTPRLRILPELAKVQTAHARGSNVDANIAAIKFIQSGRPVANEEEATCLAMYSGWGDRSEGIFKHSASAYEDRDEENRWLKEANDKQLRSPDGRAYRFLKEHLDDAAFERERASLTTAYLTPPDIVSAIHEMVVRLGFKPSRKMSILEPACSTGLFLWGGDPTMLDCRITAYDLNPTGLTICNAILEGASCVKRNVKAEDFKNHPDAEGLYDLILGNFPFSSVKPYDPAYASLDLKLHDYFMTKSFKLLRKGGLLAVVTSTTTLDGRGRLKSHLFDNGFRLVFACRLPGGTFGTTESPADIIIATKRAEPQIDTPAWLDSTSEIPDAIFSGYRPKRGGRYELNKLFAETPELVIGKINLNWQGMMKVEMPFERDALKDRILDLFDKFADKKLRFEAVERKATKPEPVKANVKEGCFEIQDGAPHINENGMLKPFRTKSRRDAELIAAYIPIRDAIAETLLMKSSSNANLEKVTSCVERLNKLCQNFLFCHGPLLNVRNRAVLSHDAMYLNCHCVETLNAKTGEAQPGPIFNPAFALSLAEEPKAGNVADAMWISLNLDGFLNMERIAHSSGLAREEIEAKFIEESLAFIDPLSNEWQPADESLSGDVKTKLALATAAAQADERFKRNVEKLSEIQPRQVGRNDIRAMPSSPWIPAKHMTDYLYEITDSPNWKVAHADKAGKWIIECTRPVSNAKTVSIYGTADMPSYAILEAVMNGRTITIKKIDSVTKSLVVDKQATLLARTKAEEMESHFMRWIWQDDERANELIEIYNERFNRFVERKWTCGKLTLPGMSKEWLAKIGTPGREYQQRAIFRGIHGGNLLLAHTVGAGKTIETIAIVMEMRRLKLIRKALVAVPNHMLGGWTQDWKSAYPAAKLLVIDRDSLDKESRQRMYALAATGDFDAIIMAHSTFSKLGVRANTEAEYVKEQIAEAASSIAAMQASGMAKFVKRAEKQKAALEERARKLSDQKGIDVSMAYEDLGIDLCLIDEAHNFKGIPFTTARQNIPGIQVSPSKRGALLDMKARYTCGTIHNWRRGLIFLTGTPISNSISEVYVMLRYLGLKELREAGLEHFDSWAGMFGRTVTEMEVSPTGTGYRTHTRFSSFHNLPELKAMFRRFTDVVLPQDLQLDVPKIAGGAAKGEECEISPAQKLYMEDLVIRAEELKGRNAPPPDVDNMLKVCTDARKAALDIRLVHIDEINEARKTVLCADNLARIYHELDGTTQCVFCDLGVPTDEIIKGAKFNVYDDLRALILERGVPAHEIAYIHDAKTDAEKAALFAKIREGVIRIIIGNTQRMGEGTNFQSKMIAIHHLDCPWKPAHYDQRNGRVFRSGNTNKEAYAFIYVTKSSFDAYMWSAVERKSKSIASFMSHDMTIRELEGDSMTLTAAEMKALASGSPIVQERTFKQIELQKLMAHRQALLSGDSQNEWTASRVKNSIMDHDNIIDACKALIKAYSPPESADDFELLSRYGSLQGSKMGEFIRDVAMATLQGFSDIGGFAGIRIRATNHGFGSRGIYASTPGARDVQLLTIDGKETPDDLIRALKSELSKLFHKIERSEAAKAKLEKDLEALAQSGNSAKIKDADAKIAELKIRIEELDALLEKNSSDSQAGTVPDAQEDAGDSIEDEQVA